jgi:hypothetical protein
MEGSMEGNKKEKIKQCGLCTRGMENQTKDIEIGSKTKLLTFLYVFNSSIYSSGCFFM